MKIILKTIVYRIVSSITTLIIAWLLTGSIVVGLSISITDAVIKTIVYYIYEKIWNIV